MSNDYANAGYSWIDDLIHQRLEFRNNKGSGVLGEFMMNSAREFHQRRQQSILKRWMRLFRKGSKVSTPYTLPGGG